MTTEIGEYYSLMPTKFPELCTTSLSPEQNQTFATIEYLYRNGIISTWPNFTNCLPQCGICTSFATDHTYMIYNLVMIGLLLPFISLCGLIGNSLSAFIYSRPRMRSSTNLYFCCLACSDIAVICTALILFFVDSIRRYSLQLSIIYGVFASVAYPAGLIAQTCSVYFTLAAAIDCFIQVCLPEKCKRFFSRVGCFQFVSAFVIIFSISYNVPRFFENIAFECWHSKFDSNSMEVCPTPLRYNDTYLYIYFYVMYTLFLAVGPLVVLVFLNTCIIFASVFLKRGKTEDNISLILVVLLFIACNTIALLLNIFEESLERNLEWRFNYLVDVSNLLVVFNSSFNIVIYYVFSKPYRHAFRHYFFPCKNVTQKNHHTSAKALLVKNSGENGHFTTNSSVVLTTTVLSNPEQLQHHQHQNQHQQQPSTSLSRSMENNYGCCELVDSESYEPSPCIECNHYITSSLPIENFSSSSFTVPSTQNSVSRIFGFSRTEVLI